MSDVTITVGAGDTTNVVVGDGDTTNVSVSDVFSAAQTTFDPSTSDLSSTDLQSAVAILANEKFAQDGTPSTGVTEGDLWYDTDDDIMYVRRDTSWTKLVQENLSGAIDGGTY